MGLWGVKVWGYPKQLWCNLAYQKHFLIIRLQAVERHVESALHWGSTLQPMQYNIMHKAGQTPF